MTAIISKILICKVCGTPSVSEEKATRCPKCGNKYITEDTEKFEYFWPIAPIRLKEDFINAKVEQSLDDQEKTKAASSPMFLVVK